jgi:uncharacterized membrane protein
MQQRAKRLAIAIILTVADIAVFHIHFGVFWQARGWNPWVQNTLVALVAVWVASATVRWFHTSKDLRPILRERAVAIPSDPWLDSNERRRESDV